VYQWGGFESISFSDSLNGTAVGSPGAILRTTDGGITWTKQESGTTNQLWSVSLTDANCGTAVGWGGTILRTTTGGVTWVKDDRTHAGELPGQVVLKQNYPNPFNPSTNIRFELPKASHVNVAVFDILGREVSVLVNERRDAGVHEVKFDASGLSSGVYFYRLRAERFVQTRKLVLLR
jgi:hypothetical protein